MDNNVTFIDLIDKQREYQVAMFENCLADDALRVMNRFKFPTPEDHRTVNEIIQKLNEYSVGEANETMERYNFYKRSQQEGEHFEHFLTNIRTLAQTCVKVPGKESSGRKEESKGAKENGSGGSSNRTELLNRKLII